jgi:hypothetical protein
MRIEGAADFSCCSLIIRFVNHRKSGFIGLVRVEWLCQRSKLLWCRVSGFRCQISEVRRQTEKIGRISCYICYLSYVICSLTPDTRHLKP